MATISNAIGQVSFFSPTGTGVSQGITVQILGDALLYTTAVRTWRLGLYSDTTGYPTAGTYDDGRLWLTGLIDNRVDSSRSDDPLNFSPTNPDGSVPTDAAISYTLNAPDVNPIFWMVPNLQGIVCGTKAGEWLIIAPTSGPIAPTNIAARRVTTIGCANIEPRHTEHTTVFVQKFGRKLMEYFADVFSGKFTAPNLAKWAKHLTASGLAEIGYQQELVPTVWSRRNDGALVGASYQRDTLMSSQGPTFIGWHGHTLGTGRLVESIAVGPSVGGNLDALTLVTNDPATGARHVEVLNDLFEEGDDQADAWMLDDAVAAPGAEIAAYTGAPYGGVTFTGLWHLNGKTVSVFCAGLDCGQTTDANGKPVISDFVVANGAVTVPYGDGVSGGTAKGLFTSAFFQGLDQQQAVIGCNYVSDGQLVRPNSREDTGARNGPGFAKKRRIEQAALQLVAVAWIKFGASFSKLTPAAFKTPGNKPYAAFQPFSGIYLDTVSDEDSYDGMICWRVDRPFPATVAAVGGFIDTKDK